VTTSTTIEALKSHFAAHGIPERLTTDNGTQYSNEAAVKTVKNMKDRQLALLNYRATPLPARGQSPSQLLMSRRLRTRLPTARTVLEPTPNNDEDVKRRMRHAKDKQKTYQTCR
jgi:hypothetical protein